MFSTSTIISIPNQYQIALDNYVSILEKTNNQLGWWLTIGNFIVTILGIMVAIIAIWVGIALWKNSKEQKDKFETFLKFQEKLLKDKTEKFDQILKEGREDAESKLEALIGEQQKKLASATADNKKEIQIAIDNLKKDKATIGANINMGSSLIYPYSVTTSKYLNSNIGTFNPGVVFLGSLSMICSTCGKSFNYNDQGFPLPRLTTKQSVYCTHCGAINMP